jgi:tRNA A-37 threonylcarbamoyl transferase component Bud32
MIGQTLKHYEIEEVLGKGGMGTVYRARDTKLQRPVALKVLTSGFTTDQERRKRFLQEARSAAALIHPAIAQVYDIDETDDVTFIAMELVEGETVSSLIAKKELDLLAALEIAVQTGEGLVKAHETGIVHRDIKPENIMVTRDGHAKILDFGLAKLDPLRSSEVADGQTAEQHISQIATMAQTQSGMVVGTVAYMSPEQARGKPVDHRSDIFSFGVTLYEMASGELPFRGESPLDTMHAIAFEETRPVTVVRQNIPPDLHRIISSCLRKRPEDRYPEVRSMVEDLKSLKRDTESGVTRSLPLRERVKERLASLKGMKPSTIAWVAGGAGILVVLIIIAAIREDIQWSTIVFLGFVGLFSYRHIRHRRRRLVKRFAAKVSKMQEVALVTYQENQATVVVDRSQARIYLRINGLIDSMNRKLFFGEPISATVRDDVKGKEFRQMLKDPGLLYVREDVFDNPQYGAS